LKCPKLLKTAKKKKKLFILAVLKQEPSNKTFRDHTLRKPQAPKLTPLLEEKADLRHKNKNNFLFGGGLTTVERWI